MNISQGAWNLQGRGLKNELDDAAIYEPVTVHSAVYEPSIQVPCIAAFNLDLPWIRRSVNSGDVLAKTDRDRFYAHEDMWYVDGDPLTNEELGCLYDALTSPGQIPTDG
jgi:hypothetical protein